MTHSPLCDRDVLVTGGTGAFGQAFVRHALACGARRVVVLSRGEAKQAMMMAQMPDPRLRFLIGDVRDAARVRRACRGVDIVVHAAALKRVEVCQAEPNEAIATNVIGSLNVADACIAEDVQRAIFLSTDKASNPSTMYGATKMAAEAAWVQYNVYSAGTQTRFSATRYGNVLGSTGSVVPMWRHQETRGAIGITDANMTRFWMTMQQAVDLVEMAIDFMRGGEVFVPKCTSSSIGELAKIVCPHAAWAKVPERPGEKFHESLVGADESRYTYDAGDHFIIEPCIALWEDRAPSQFPRVPEGFTYTSDNNPYVGDTETLTRMVTS